MPDKNLLVFGQFLSADSTETAKTGFKARFHQLE